MNTRAPDDLLRELTQTRDLKFLPQLASFLFHGSEGIAGAAAAAVARLLTSVPADALPRVEQSVRTAWRSSYVHEWPRDAHSAERLLREHERRGVEILGLLSFHPSGWVREGAVQRLTGVEDGAELRYLLLRLNDWVPAVSQAAQAAIRARLSGDAIAAFAPLFALVERVARGPHAPILREPLARFAVTARGREVLLPLVHAAPRTTARAIVRFHLDFVADGAAAVADAGLSSGDAVIRTWVTPLAPPAVLPRLTEDPSPRVRGEALAVLARTSPGEARPHLERALLDTSGSVRESARFLLRGAGLGFAAVYRKALELPGPSRPLAGAIHGLGETGLAADAHAAASFLSHRTAIVRVAAVKSVMRLAGGEFAPRVAGMLDDPSRSVSAAARKTLLPHAPALGAGLLRGIFTSATHRHARRNAIALLAALPKWESIAPLIEAAADPDDEVAAVARRYAIQWNAQYNRGHSTPSRRQLDDLANALARAGSALGQELVDEIRFGMRSFEGES